MNKKVLTYLSIAFLIIGLAGAVNIFISGEHAFATSNGVPWGSLISGYEFFIGISTGLLLVAALGYVFQVKSFLPMAKNAVLLAIFTMFSGFFILLIELGNVFHMFYYFISPNFKSPMWWLAPLYSIYLILLFILMYNIIKENQKKIKFYATLAFISAIVALGNIGFLFGFLQARPYWYGPLSPVYFVVTAFFSGIAVLSIATYLSKEKNEYLTSIPMFRKIILLCIALMTFIYLSKIVTGLFGGVSGKYEVVNALINGPLSFNFWVLEVLLGLFIPLVLVAKNVNAKKLGFSGLSSIMGIFFMRLDMVVAGQIYPLKVVYGGAKDLAYHSYFPAWSEWALILGGAGITLFLYLLRNSMVFMVKRRYSNKTISQ